MPRDPKSTPTCLPGGIVSISGRHYIKLVVSGAAILDSMRACEKTGVTIPQSLASF